MGGVCVLVGWGEMVCVRLCVREWVCLCGVVYMRMCVCVYMCVR